MVEKIVERDEIRRPRQGPVLDRLSRSTKGEEKHKILIEFYALRDAKGRYLGCMECTQDVQDIIGLQGRRDCWTEETGYITITVPVSGGKM